MRWRLAVLLLAGGVLLLLPPSVSARCYGTGVTFRCDPVISESLRRKSLGLPPRYTPRSAPRYRYEGSTFTLPSTGATVHRYKFKDGRGNTYRGKIETFPGGTVRHHGSWR